MELPHLGKNCALKECNQLDFLPVKCDACQEIFCLRHYQYDTHNCEKAQSKNVQVPVCPLCSEPVTSRRGELPDVAVSSHIDQYCKQNELIKSKSKNQSTSRATSLKACAFKSCKQKDLIYLECTDCHSKYCIKHRHPSDHSCSGPTMASNLADNWQSLKESWSSSGASSSFEQIKNKAQQLGRSGQAALNRIAASTSRANHSGPNNSRNHAVNSLQGNISEQEALVIALGASQANPKQGQAQAQLQLEEDEDLALARAIHASELEARNRSQTVARNNKDSCVLS